MGKFKYIGIYIAYYFMNSPLIAAFANPLARIATQVFLYLKAD